MTSDQTRRLSRRGFLQAGAAGLAGAPLAACAAESDSAASRRRPALTRPEGIDDVAWAHVREQFILEPGTAYMNNASLGMPPAAVAEAVGAGYQALSREPLQGKNELGAFIASDVVPCLAAYLGAAADEIVLTRNATEALHIGAIGVRLKPGDEVLITSQEHPAGRRPWEFRARRDGIKVNTVFIPSPFESEDQVLGLVEEALTPATRVLAFCHVTRGGHLYPVTRLCAMARARGIVSHVDGAQAVGMFPVDLRELGSDTYSASIHVKRKPFFVVETCLAASLATARLRCPLLPGSIIRERSPPGWASGRPGRSTRAADAPSKCGPAAPRRWRGRGASASRPSGRPCAACPEPRAPRTCA